MNHAALRSLPCRELSSLTFLRRRSWLTFLALLGVTTTTSLAQTGTALVRHAPSVNGNIQGSVQQMLGESVTFNSGANVTGNLLVIGSPTVQLNGSPTYGGT